MQRPEGATDGAHPQVTSRASDSLAEPRMQWLSPLRRAQPPSRPARPVTAQAIQPSG